jgi:hypothetical protein
MALLNAINIVLTNRWVSGVDSVKNHLKAVQ